VRAAVSGDTTGVLPLVRSEHLVERRPSYRNGWQSSILGVAGELSAPMLRKQQQRRDLWISIKAVVIRGGT
jgi:hypothetical protein